jgi:hypothetical protein
MRSGTTGGTDFEARLSAGCPLFLIAPQSHEHGRYGGRPAKEDKECSLRDRSDNVITMLSFSRFEIEARFNRPIPFL